MKKRINCFTVGCSTCKNGIMIKKNFWGDKLYICPAYPEKHKEVIKLYFGFYGKRYKQKEIANKLGISQSYISRLVKKSGKLIKQMFKDIGIFSYNDLEYFDYSLLDQSIDSFNPSDKSNSEQTKCNDDIVSNPKCLSKKLIPKK